MQNILGIIDTNGNLMVKYSYTAYGKYSPIGDLNLDNINPFKYKGYYYDRETNMYYCKSRYYNPEWCRWLNGDHTAYLDLEDINGLNLFSYCKNNPLMNIDEEGDLAISLGFAIAMGLAALFAVVMTKPEINQEVASILDDGLKFIEDTIKFNITMRVTTLMLVYSALDNVMMSKRHEEAEHRKNREPHNLETHQNGQARKRRDKGGEKGDERRTKKDKWYKKPKGQKNLKKIANSIVKYF